MFEISTIVEYAAAFGTISVTCGFIVRLITKDVARDVVDVKTAAEDLKHSVKNQTSRIDQIERLRVADVERIVKLETNLSNLEKGQERIEHSLDKIQEDSERGRAEIIDSIRELRTVALKD